jgi:hypothetical protein
LGEDRFLTTLMLKHFPDRKNTFTSSAVCYTIVPDDFSVLLSQRRRWINSTVHNLFELVFLPQLCGCLCFSMRAVVFFDLFATLIMPASVAYLIYLIIAAIQEQSIPTISLVMLAAAYGLQSLIFIAKGEFQHIGWMIISILAMPVFSFYLPLYAYWHFDDFSWGNTRRIAGLKDGAHGGEGDAEVFDPNEIPLTEWDQDSILAKRKEYRLEGKEHKNIPLNVMIEKTTDPILKSSALAKSTEEDDDALLITHLKQRYVSDDEMKERIKMIIEEEFLETLTKRMVRQKLSDYFGVDLESRKDFISLQIDEILKERRK